MFDNEEHFRKLNTPINDARFFSDLLKEYGDFEIIDILLNAPAETIRKSIEKLYNSASVGDLTLLYYSGHGYRDRNNRYYLIAKDSSLDFLLTSGIRETFIHDAMSSSCSKHKVIILDCCFSGAFIKGYKGNSDLLLLTDLKGEATAILTSSSRVQFSFEANNHNSLFTDYLIDGIKTGKADKDNTGYILIEDLFHYAESKVREVRPEQTPMMEISARDTAIFITKNPNIQQSISKVDTSKNFLSSLSQEEQKSLILLRESILLSQTTLTRNQVIAQIHPELSLLADSKVMAKFYQMNQVRKNKGLQENYNAIRYRVICPPLIDSSFLKLVLAPVDFAFVAVLKEKDLDSSLKSHMLRQVEKLMDSLPEYLKSDDPMFDFMNFNMLGTQLCLITSNKQTHLRKRGASVLFAGQRWDVSVSGFCGESDTTNNHLDLALTIEHEVQREIAFLRGDPRQIIFTGIHKNTRTGAIDVLSYWQIQTPSKELIQKIVLEVPTKPRDIFNTTQRAIEPFVWDTKNIIVNFDTDSILYTLEKCNVKLTDFEPQSVLCLELALKAFGQDGLGVIEAVRCRKSSV